MVIFRIFVDQNSSLVFQNVHLDDTGVYQCYAHNEAGEDLLAFWLKVTCELCSVFNHCVCFDYPSVESASHILSNFLDLDGWVFAPQLITPADANRSLTVIEEFNATLVCPIDGAPFPTYLWYKESTQNGWIPIGNSSQKLGSASTNSTTAVYKNELRIQSTHLNDSGHYRCMATNRLGQQHAHIHVDVIARTRSVAYLPSRMTVRVNDSLRLRCAVLATTDGSLVRSKPVEFIWLHGRFSAEGHAVNMHQDMNKQITRSIIKDFHVSQYGDAANRTAEKKYSLFGSILSLNKMNTVDAGIYICQANSAGGNLTFQTEIKVNFSLPKILYN
ncbi:hypothetical protein PHET_01325 [Paragonimus heterotremus]|uniref:Ig-like domain-containing protein n=1 Tax=Paragonimus heterotremus TaxID=100268 RepID=A0A8J4TN92_9TREM|nr:hypothetical protein PHET_01325 [Paragonimus heterotremus]